MLDLGFLQVEREKKRLLQQSGACFFAQRTTRASSGALFIVIIFLFLFAGQRRGSKAARRPVLRRRRLLFARTRGSSLRLRLLLQRRRAVGTADNRIKMIGSLKRKKPAELTTFNLASWKRSTFVVVVGSLSVCRAIIRLQLGARPKAKKLGARAQQRDFISFSLPLCATLFG